MIHCRVKGMPQAYQESPLRPFPNDISVMHTLKTFSPYSHNTIFSLHNFLASRHDYIYKESELLTYSSVPIQGGDHKCWTPFIMMTQRDVSIFFIINFSNIYSLCSVHLSMEHHLSSSSLRQVLQGADSGVESVPSCSLCF